MSGGGSGCCCTGVSVCGLSCSTPGPRVPVTLCNEGGNSDVGAVIDDGVDRLRETVGLWDAIDFYDKEGKHWGIIDHIAKQDTSVTKPAPTTEETHASNLTRTQANTRLGKKR